MKIVGRWRMPRGEGVPRDMGKRDPPSGVVIASESARRGLRERATKSLKGLCVGTGKTAPEKADGSGVAPRIERSARPAV